MRYPINRRQVLRLAGLATAGAFVASNAGSRAFAQAATRHAPFLPFLRRLPIRRTEPGLVEAAIIAVPHALRVGGESARLWNYNGSFPGPVLEVKEGDHVRLHFINHLPEETNLHLHGLHISPAVDNPFLSVPRGESVFYEFTVPQGSRGLHWYHPHVHGHVATQLFAGLAGPILVRSSEDDGLSDADDRLIVLKDLELLNGQPAPHGVVDWLRGKEGNLRLVNGALDPVLVAKRGLLRLRFLNASNARYYRLALEAHVLHLVATDGHLLAEPIVVDEILLAPGERAEALVSLEREGRFALLDLPYDRGAGMMHMGGMGGGPGRDPVRLMTVVAPAGLDARPIPSSLAAVEDFRHATPDVTRRLILGEGMMMRGSFTINGRAFDPERVDLASRLDSLEVWEVENRGGMDHPFHLHTYPFQVLSRNGFPEAVVVWKDVANVRPGETVRIAVPLRDFTGRTVYHCHIVEHEDRGMMGTLEVTPG